MKNGYRELLIGCGNNLTKKVIRDGTGKEWKNLTTLDIDRRCKADVYHDLCVLPYPFVSDTFDEIHAYEVLEHTGQQGDYLFFFSQFEEFWRILKPGGVLFATVPAEMIRTETSEGLAFSPNVWLWGDPGHTRIINPGSLHFLSQKNYDAEVGQTAMTDYRWCYKGDFTLGFIKHTQYSMIFGLTAVKPAFTAWPERLEKK